MTDDIRKKLNEHFRKHLSAAVDEERAVEWLSSHPGVESVSIDIDKKLLRVRLKPYPAFIHVDVGFTCRHCGAAVFETYRPCDCKRGGFEFL